MGFGHRPDVRKPYRQHHGEQYHHECSQELQHLASRTVIHVSLMSLFCLCQYLSRQDAINTS